LPVCVWWSEAACGRRGLLLRHSDPLSERRVGQRGVEGRNGNHWDRWTSTRRARLTDCLCPSCTGLDGWMSACAGSIILAEREMPRECPGSIRFFQHPSSSQNDDAMPCEDTHTHTHIHTDRQVCWGVAASLCVRLRVRVGVGGRRARERLIDTMLTRRLTDAAGVSSSLLRASVSVSVCVCVCMSDALYVCAAMAHLLVSIAERGMASLSGVFGRRKLLVFPSVHRFL